MKQAVDIVVVIPVGPNSSLAFLRDTIESVIHYSRASCKVIVADDSQQGLGKMMQHELTAIDIDVMTTHKSFGSMAGLYITLSAAFKYAVSNYTFKLLFKVDTDALVIGDEPEKEALAFFKENPLMAIAGQYPLDYHGKPWDTAWPRARIINGTMTWKFFRRPMANLVLRKLYMKALENGYRTGESVFGGAYFMSYEFLIQLEKRQLLPEYRLKNLRMGEDHLFALLAKSMGFELGNLSDGRLPFGCAWKGLPASPEQLLRDGKKVIHSTRSWANMNEEQIRIYFREKRKLQVLNPEVKELKQGLTPDFSWKE